MHLRKVLFAVVLVPLGACAALGQTYYDSGGTIVSGVMPLPYTYTPLPPSQHNLAPTSAAPLTIPAGARTATICASAASAKYTTDGVTVPTMSVGQPLAAGSCLFLSGAAVLANFRVVSASGTLDIEYFR
jgi:hypothetical protein